MMAGHGLLWELMLCMDVELADFFKGIPERVIDFIWDDPEAFFDADFQSDCDDNAT